MIGRIDSHQHFWRIGANDCSWPTPELPIHRDYLPDDLAPLIVAAGVAGTIVVQSQESDRDTDWLCDVAAETPWIFGVVGWADLKARNAPARIAALAARAKLVGLRPMLQGLEDDWILDPAAGPALDAVETHGLAFDALVKPRHLAAVGTLAAARPGLSIVIDHAAKPDIARGEWQPWADAIASVAAHANVVCKLSGLATEAAPGWSAATLRRYVDHLIAVFGAERLLWGSDWPVLDLAGDYAGWVAETDALLARLSGEQRVAVLGGNASKVYGIAAG